ncbi:MAG: hypothetical protein LRY55_09005 [Leadbetterella sp.]|nr:hypothetical protein [Leadbetterella sp.]
MKSGAGGFLFFREVDFLCPVQGGMKLTQVGLKIPFIGNNKWLIENRFGERKAAGNFEVSSGRIYGL